MRMIATSLGITMAAACSGPGNAINSQELITTVILTFSHPNSGEHVAEWNDPDGDGGAPPTVSRVALTHVGTFAVSVRFENRLGTVPEDITTEVRDEAEHHLVLFTGAGVDGPATNNPNGLLKHAYDDADANGLPIGLTNLIGLSDGGTAKLTITLRHMPPEEPPVKSADTVQTVKTSGISAIGGSTDAQVDFEVDAPSS